LEKNLLLSSKERKHQYGAPKLWNLAISRERNKGKIVCSGPLKQTWAGVELVNKFQYQVQKGVRREWYDFVIDDESKEVNGGLDDSDKNTRRRREQVSQRNVLLHTAKPILKEPPVKNCETSGSQEIIGCQDGDCESFEQFEISTSTKRSNCQTRKKGIYSTCKGCSSFERNGEQQVRFLF
jgi:hypothetical protein